MKSRHSWLSLLVLLILLGSHHAVVVAEELAQERLVVGVKEAPPFVMQGSDGEWHGLSIELWRLVAADLQLEYELQEFDLGELRGAIQHSEVDVLVGALSITPEREEIVDFTHTYFVSSLGIAVPAGNDSAFGALSFLFSTAFLKLIASLTLVLILCGALMWWLERKSNPEQFEADGVRGVGAGIWWAAVTMTTVGYGDKAPVSLGGRLVALVWMFSSLMLVSVFTGAVASVMTVSGLNSKVKGPEDLPRVRVASLEGSVAGLWLEEERIGYVGYPSLGAALESVSAGRADAVVYDHPILTYLVRERGDDALAVLPRKFALNHYGFVLPPESPLREPMNRAILKRTLEPEWSDIVFGYTGNAPD